MCDLGEARVCLGLEITRDRSKRTIHVSQEHYANKVLERFSMHNSKPVVTPMDGQLGGRHDDNLACDVPYRQVIGSLMCLMVGTRPDIAFAVGRLCRFADCATWEHWTAAKRVLRYISGTRGLGITYDGANNDLTPHGYCDSDYASFVVNRRSRSCFCFHLAGGAISWRSKQQTSTAVSSVEAEYIAMCAATKQSLWLSRLLSDLSGRSKKFVIKVKVDNQGAISLANNTVDNDSTKHIDVQYCGATALRGFDPAPSGTRRTPSSHSARLSVETTLLGGTGTRYKRPANDNEQLYTRPRVAGSFSLTARVAVPKPRRWDLRTGVNRVLDYRLISRAQERGPGG